MIAATVITVFNGRTDKANRREVFAPTRIFMASYMEARGSSHSKGVSGEAIQFKLRIPLDAPVQDDRTFVNEATYKALSDEEAANHWTLRKGDYILVAHSDRVPETITQPELDALARELRADLIRITEYADNTVRGTDAVKHWRIGGA